MSQMKHLELHLIITCLVLSMAPGPAECLNCSTPTTLALLHALKQSVFYTTEVRPVLSLKTPTVIYLDLYIFGILGVSEKGQVLEMFIWLYLYWNIEGLSWDPSECGVERISLPRNTLWMPDIVINEFMDDNKVPDTFYLYVDHEGMIQDAQPVHAISSCNLDIYNFPFDIQNCTYTFNSYLHTMSDVQLRFAAAVENVFENSLNSIGTNGEWELIGLIPEKPPVDGNLSLNEQYDKLVFHIVLRRKPAVYVVNLLLPSCFLVAVDVFSLLLPPQHLDRSAFKMTLILGYTVFLLLMNDLLPITGNNIPLLNMFFSVCLALMVGSLLETVFITNLLCGSAGYPRLPGWVRLLILQYGARLVCLDTTSSNEEISTLPGVSEDSGGSGGSEALENEERGNEKEENLGNQELLQELRNMSRDLSSIQQKIQGHLRKDTQHEDWIRLGLVLDRMFFILYIIFITISFLTMFMLWLCWYRKHSS